MLLVWFYAFVVVYCLAAHLFTTSKKMRGLYWRGYVLTSGWSHWPRQKLWRSYSRSIYALRNGLVYCPKGKP